MPLYEYRCSKCGVEIEVVRVVDGIAPVCACGSVMERLMSVFSWIWEDGKPGV